MTDTAFQDKKSTVFSLGLLGVVLASLSVFCIQEDVKWATNYTDVLIMAGIGGFLLAGVFHVSRLSLPSTLIIFFSLGAIAAGFSGALLGVLLFWLVCWGTGITVNHLFFDRHSLNTPRASFSRHLILGYVLVALALTIMVYTRYNTPLAYLLVFGTPTVFGLILYFNAQENAFKNKPREKRKLTATIFLIPLAITLCLLFVFALQPDMGSDSIAAYRAVLLELRDYGAFNYNPEHSSIRLLPLSGLWPQSFAVTISGEYEAAKLYNFSILIVTVIVAQDINKGEMRPSSLNLVIAMLLSVPMFLHITLSGFYDNSIIFLTLCYIFLVEKLVTRDSENPIQNQTAIRYAILIGLLAGLMILTKTTTLFIAPVLAIYIVASLYKKTSLSNLLKVAFIIGLVTAIVWGIFLYFVYHKTGNPVFPYYNDLFKSPYYSDRAFQSPHTGYMSWRLIWDMTFETGSYAQAGSRDGALGLLGILFLLALGFFIFIFRSKKNSVKASLPLGLLGFFLGLVILSAFENSPRYMVILVPFLIIPLSELLRKLGQINALIITIFVVGTHLYLMPNSGWGVAYKWGVLKSNHEKLIKTRRPLRHISDELSHQFGRTGRVLFLNNNAGYTGRAYINGWYDNKTNSEFTSLYADDQAKFISYLSENSLDAVVVASDGFKTLKKQKNLSILSYLKNASNRVEILGDVTAYYLNHSIAFQNQTDMAPTANIAKAHQFFNKKGIADIVFDLQYTCTDIRAIRFITVNPLGKWVSYQDYYPSCDGNEETIKLEHRELKPENRHILTTVPGTETNLNIIGGTVYSR